MPKSEQMPKIKYLSEAEIIAINEEMVAKFGGIHGVRDLGLLQSAVGRPQLSVALKDAYHSIFDKAAALLHSIINNHPFLDGNKRTSLFSAILFLEYNGCKFQADKSEMVSYVKRIHDEKLSTEQIAAWLKSHCRKV